MESQTSKIQRTFTGTVVSAGAPKTIVVKVDRMKLHSKYQKRYRVSKKYHVHDEERKAKPGDRVEFSECRPISKTKRWRLVAIQQKVIV